jgi:hypothetical protein
MGADDKKSFWSSLPGILTGLAGVMTAAGALIYHNANNPKKRSSPPAAVVSSEAVTSSQPQGFTEQASYNGDCANPPAGSTCVHFRDGYDWLVRDEVEKRRNEIGSWGNHAIMEASGKQGRYQHILGTQYVKTTGL